MGLNFISNVFLVVCVALYTNAHTVHQTGNPNYALVTHLTQTNGNTLEFQLTVKTLIGWVGVGVNNNPSMIDADLCIVTKDPANDTLIIIKDYYGNKTNGEPILDTKPESDWTVAHFVANETTSTRTIHVRRLLKTADTNPGQDIEITEDPIHIVWAYGATDEIGEHTAKGAIPKVNLLEESGGGASTTPEEGSSASTTPGGGGGGNSATGKITFALMASLIVFLLIFV